MSKGKNQTHDSHLAPNSEGPFDIFGILEDAGVGGERNDDPRTLQPGGVGKLFDWIDTRPIVQTGWWAITTGRFGLFTYLK